jgi:citrate/tricarballylate utilization protein
MHSLVVYGFLCDTVATISAAIMQDFLDQMPPYPLLSVPVVLGSIGGIAMIIGSTDLLRLKSRSDTRPAFAKMISKDYGFLVSLALVSITGMLVLMTRETAALGPVLAIHLGTVAAFFVAMPYGKFVHFLYRYGALVQNRLEEDHYARSLEPAKEA